MKIYSVFLLFLGVCSFMGCEEDPDSGPQIAKHEDLIYPGRKVFVMNEGNYGQGTGSLTLYDPETGESVNHVFEVANERSLGDVPQSMTIHDDHGYIVVNNSSKIEVINLDTYESVATITGFRSPRYLEVVAENKAYVSDLYSDSMYVVNLEKNILQKTFYTGFTTEEMVVVEGNVLAVNWSNVNKAGNTVLKIDVSKDSLIDTLKVNDEPNSIVKDDEGYVWVLCGGGYQNADYPALYKMAPEAFSIVATYPFPSKNASPSELVINEEGDSLFYLHEGIRTMAIGTRNLPDNPLISVSGKNFYRLGIDPRNSDIYVTDPLDYTQSGYVYRYSTQGRMLDSFRADIIPANFCFEY